MALPKDHIFHFTQLNSINSHTFPPLRQRPWADDAQLRITNYELRITPPPQSPLAKDAVSGRTAESGHGPPTPNYELRITNYPAPAVPAG